jgi:HSP20 family protein
VFGKGAEKMAIDRWNPFQDMLALRDAMERMMQDTFTRSGGMSGRGSFPIDLVENENGYVMHASLPGFKPDEVQVQVTGDTLTIRGEHREEPQTNQENQQYLMRERRVATVYRAITLPAPIDADKAQANFEHGVLTLTLPRAQSAQPKQISIGGMQQSTQGQLNQGGTAGGQMTSGGTSQATSGQGTGQTASQNANGAMQSGNTARTGTMPTNPVDQASAESFPASDAPSSMSAGTSP